MADEESVPIPDWHRKIIEERLKSHRAKPSRK
ncbi:MAG: addiction module protein [Acidobacteria bacterium]|nr:addiction module protein [Acidobacteriota bacterium]